MWALQFTCIKLVQNQVGPLFTVWGPMTLATIMLYPLIRFEPRQQGERHFQKRRWLTYLALAGFGVVPGQVLMTWGTRASLASDAAILNLTLPILTAFFAFLFLGERMTSVRWISFSIAIAGVLLCSGRAAHARYDYRRNTGARQHSAHHTLGRSQSSYRCLGRL